MSGYSGLSVDEMMMLARKDNKNKQPAPVESAASQSEGEAQPASEAKQEPASVQVEKAEPEKKEEPAPVQEPAAGVQNEPAQVSEENRPEPENRSVVQQEAQEGRPDVKKVSEQAESLESNKGHSEANESHVTEQPAAKPKNKHLFKRKSKAPGAGVTAKGITGDVMDYVRLCFKDEAKYADLLSAYVYITSQKAIDVPPDVKELAKSWNSKVTPDMLSQRIKDLENQLKSMTRLIRELELALSYLVFDKVGFRKQSPGAPNQVNFMEDGVRAVIGCLRTQTNRLEQKEDNDMGRPIR